MKKWTALLLTLVLLLCGCAAEDPAVPGTTVPQPTTEASAEITQPQTANMHIVELTIWVTEDILWQDTARLDAMLEEFNAYYPNILVTVAHVSEDRIGTEKPNLVLANTDSLSRWAAQGSLTELDAIWETLASDAYGNVEAACSDGEHFYTLPLCVVADCMAIRLPEFERAQATGLLNPAGHTWTGGNFLQAVANLRDAGVENSLSIYCRDTDGDVYTRLLVENLENGRYVNTINGSYQLDSREMSSALSKLSSTEGIAIRPDQTASDALNDFLTGETAIVLSWNSALQLQHGGDGEILYMLYPCGTRARTYARVYGLGLFTNEDVQQQAASMTLMQFLSGSDEAVRATGQLPARKSQTDVYEGTDLEKTMSDLSKLLGYMAEGEIPGNSWELGRGTWVQLLRQIAAQENLEEEERTPLTELIEAAQKALSQE